jgi:AraC-like DNA-binding protein
MKIDPENYPNLKFQTIESEGLQIAATIETENNDEHPIYHPSNILYYMIEGQFNLKMNHQLHIIPEGGFCLVRKYTYATCFKTWGEKQKGARMIAFVLQDEFIKDMLNDVSIQNIDKEKVPQVVSLQETPLLKGLVNSLAAYFHGNQELDKEIVKLKTIEALMALLHADDKIKFTLKDFSLPERADLVQFMNHNYMYNFPLERFASLSGRSLSTFHRDFKSIFRESPHKWIMKQRLTEARRLIQQGKKASEIYLEVGFEDLAHFSKRFKSFFGINPSEISLSNV